MTPLVRRLIVTAGVDCAEAAFDSANSVLYDILSVLTAKSRRGEDKQPEVQDTLFEGAVVGSGVGRHDDRRSRIAEKLLMQRDG